MERWFCVIAEEMMMMKGIYKTRKRRKGILYPFSP